MEKLLEKGDVFKLKQLELYGSGVAAYLAGKYIVSNVADREWYGSSNWKYKTKKREVFCESLEPKGTKISFFQSEGDRKIFGLKILASDKQGLGIDLLEGEKAAAKKNYSTEWATTEKMGNQKADKDTSSPDWDQIFKDYSAKYGYPLTLHKDAIDKVVKDAIESTAHRIIKEFREGIKKVIGN